MKRSSDPAPTCDLPPRASDAGPEEQAFRDPEPRGREYDEDGEFEPECACVRIDVDLDDARDCPLHGPRGPIARGQWEREAAEEAAYWRDCVGPFRAPAADNSE